MQKYRQKHKEVYQGKDALRTRNYRQKSIATATAAYLVTEQNNGSAFSQAYIKSRIIQKVAKHSQKALENAKKSFQHWQTNSSCALRQPNQKQEDQKTG